MAKTLHKPFSSETLGPNARLAADTLDMKATSGIATWLLHVMDMAFQEQFTGHMSGTFREDPDRVYLDFQCAIGACMIDQYIPTNPLTIANHGYESGTERGASTGIETVVLDGITIDSPEAVAEHLERIVFPALKKAIAEINPDDDQAVARLIQNEYDAQALFGPEILKVPYSDGFQDFPYLRYTAYGYANYFMAFLMYPELMEKDFSLQADLAVKRNAIAARAIVEGRLPRAIRLDHDMADSSGTLVDVRMLDTLWFPHFARSIQPFLDADVRLLWHCDGNLMAMVPRLIDAGIGGFQGFQYEDGMDYERICRMTTRDGGPLMIWAGVSVTTTLPFGTPGDVRTQLDWLVEHGPPVGLFLGASSSITPGVPHGNLRTLIDGLAYYGEKGRA